ncbi:MAG: hypothetical protein JWP69_550 [Flaviaesturariibacter sp.]|nr:hypothetical protein [Flaviaesturariibacter sp.]
MIQKIVSLTSVGKFKAYQASGDVCFKKLTAIYADNGSGKTTLAAIFRSLTTGNVDSIKKRKSIGATLPQAAQIIEQINGGTAYHTLRAAGWSVVLPGIEVFDIHFINSNVFSGCDFTDDQKKQLYQFVIGAQGVAIQQQIEQNKTNKAASRQKLDALEQQLIHAVGCGLVKDKLARFYSIRSVASDIDAQIAVAEAALVSANASSTIQRLPSLMPLLPLPAPLDFRLVTADLAATTKTIQDQALQTLFEVHCKDLNDNSITAPEPWLKAGFLYYETIREGASEEVPMNLHCPFCKQQVGDSLEVIKAYASKFNDDFNSLVQRLSDYWSILNNFKFDALIQQLRGIVDNNITIIGSWAAHLPITTIPPVIAVSPDALLANENIGLSLKAIEQKIGNPSLPVGFECFSTLQNCIDKINVGVVVYNRLVTDYNSAIQAFKAGIKPVAEAQEAVNRLKRSQKRFQANIDALCRQIASEKLQLKRLEDAYPILVQQQEAAASAFFTLYRDRINHYLGTVFQTPFQIDNVRHVAPQGRATQSRMAYELTINGQPISFDNTQNHNTKDCLSEGDKSTLAFAFFLAKLDVDPNKSDKILVFDDPLSSFDRNRRLMTVQTLRNLLDDVKQVIVLSHNEHFLHALLSSVERSGRKELGIVQNALTQESTITEISIEKMVEHDYFKHVNELEEFLRSADLTKKEIVLGLMRNVLESHLRFKFYRQLPRDQNTLGTLISTLDTSGVPFRDNANRADIIRRLRLINGISCKPHHGEPTPDYNLLGMDPQSITATELAQEVQATLQLIDSRL